MTTTDADHAGAMTAADSTSTDQTTLEEFVDEGRCRAISVRSSRRCRHDALPGVPYCADHYHLLDADDLSDASTFEL